MSDLFIINQNYPTDDAPISIQNATITSPPTPFYTGSKVTQNFQLSLNDKILTPDRDYVIYDNKKVELGTYTATFYGVGKYTGSTTQLWKIKNKGVITPSVNSITMGGIGSNKTITITKTGTGTISANSNNSNIATVNVTENNLSITTSGLGETEIVIHLEETEDYTYAELVLPIEVIPVYGVDWDKSSSTTLVRTDDAALFADPNPAIGTGEGSSPFDEIYPWSEIKRATIDGNEMVEIPKFYYKWTDGENSLKLQIAPKPIDGFFISPAHADRGDDVGERNYVYVGRYHCSSGYKSITGATPLTSITRDVARTGCTSLGTGYYQYDYAMLWTIRMLYLVEFADWDAQKVIGYGCGNNSARQNTGNSDSMIYHTGTSQSSRTTYGVGVQYRYIEGLWDNVFNWCDGIVMSSNVPYVTNVVANYGDSTSNHTKVGDSFSSTGCISDWSIPTTSGLEWALYPSAVSGTDYTVYCADQVNTNSTYVVVYVGGAYGQNRVYGLFYLCSYPVSSYASIGARLQYLPPAS